MKPKVICISLFLLTGCCTILPGQNTFYRTFGHVTEGGEGRNVAQAADGGYFLSYYIYYQSEFIACITRVNCAGETEWEQFFDGGMVTLPVDLIPQADNGCMVSFSVRENNGKWMLCIARLDETGNQVWTRNMKLRAGNLTGHMTQHTDSTIFICGNDTVAPNGIRGTTVARFSAQGQLIWQKHFADGQEHTPLGIAVTAGRVFVMGYAGFDANPFTNLFVFSLDLGGQFIRRRVFSTYYDDEPRSICADGAGNIYLTGRSYFINTAWDGMFLKLNGQLQVLESKFIDGGSPQGEWPWRIRSTPDNNIALFGDEGGFNERNPMLIKSDRGGNVLFAKRYQVSTLFTNYIFDGWPCRDGGFLMTGDVRPASLQRIAPLMKTDASGNMNCLTSDLTLTVRHETMGVLDTSLNMFMVPGPVGTQPLPHPSVSPVTNSIAFCQQFAPCGDFSIQPDSLCPAACFTFTDNSAHATSWQWAFPGGIPSVFAGQFPPQVCYPQPGIYPVSLMMSNPLDSVTYTQQVIAFPDCPILVPDIFTPNGDGINDIFMAEGIYEPFGLQVFNRWGLSVFGSGTPGSWWDGRGEDAKVLPDGVYFYILDLPSSGRRHKGTVQLQR